MISKLQERIAELDKYREQVLIELFHVEGRIQEAQDSLLFLKNEEKDAKAAEGSLAEPVDAKVDVEAS